MKTIKTLLKWSAITVGALVGYAWFSGLPEIRQTLVMLFGLASAGFWYSTKLTADAEARINKRIDWLNNRLDRLDPQTWHDSE